MGKLRTGLALAALCAAMGFSTAGAGASVPSTAIRVDQLGYPTTAPKRAYLMSRVDEAGADLHAGARGRRGGGAQRHGRRLAWLVEQALRPRLPARLRRAQRAWHVPVAVGGPAPAPRRRSRSPRPARCTRRPLANALSFYENERDGPEFIPSALRTAPAHLNDATPTTYLTPQVNDERRVQGRPDEPSARRSTPRAAGGTPATT